MKAIVLSGGGAKGAYQVGVFKALRKMNYKYDIVTGTSIGALNGMFFAQKQFYRCLSLWRKVDFNFLFDDFTSSISKKDIYVDYFNKSLKGGVKMNKMEKILDKYYNPKKLYDSNIKYGVVSYNLTTKTHNYSTTSNTSPMKLRDYIIASGACYPVFEPKKIYDDSHIDGGYYDNIPINLAIELGATEILAIDLGAIGFLKKPKNKKVKISYLKPSSRLDNFLIFNKDNITRMIDLGYTDTLKKYGKLEGERYNFKKGTTFGLNKNYKKFIKKAKEYNVKCNIKKEEFSRLIEEAMDIFKLDKSKIYYTFSINESIKRSFNKTEYVSLSEFDKSKIKKIFKRKTIVKNIYMRLDEKIPSSTVLFFNDELMIAIYIKTIMG